VPVYWAHKPVGRIKNRAKMSFCIVGG
jgi:hypothetical protein